MKLASMQEPSSVFILKEIQCEQKKQQLRRKVLTGSKASSGLCFLSFIYSKWSFLLYLSHSVTCEKFWIFLLLSYFTPFQAAGFSLMYPVSFYILLADDGFS